MYVFRKRNKAKENEFISVPRRNDDVIKSQDQNEEGNKGEIKSTVN